jgi:hypothetical protein
MGNKQNAKTNYNLEVNKKLDNKISESLGYRNNKTNLNLFLEGFTHKLKKKLSKSSKFSQLLHDENYLLSTSHNLLKNIFDSNTNFESYRTRLNISFPNSLFFYNIIEENSKDQETFIKEKVELINSIFSNEGFKDDFKIKIEEADSSLVKSLEINSLKISNETVREVEDLPSLNSLGEKVEKSERVKILKQVNRNNDKEAENNILVNPNAAFKTETQRNNNKTDLNSNENAETSKTNHSDKSLAYYNNDIQTNKFVGPDIYNKSTGKHNKLISPNTSNMPNNIIGRKIKQSIEESSPPQNFLKENANNLYIETKESLNNTERSKSKTKKRNYNKAPVVNIKIDIKDFIKQDALEKSFLTERNPVKIRQISGKSPTKTMNISKDHTISNICDSSFVDVVDVLSETKREYLEAKKKKTQSKSPQSKDKLFYSKLYINSTFQDERKSRIKYKNERYLDDQPSIQSRDNIIKNLKSSKIIK